MYIPKKRKEELRYEFPENTPVTPEELAWVLTSIVTEYLHGINPTEPNSYPDFNEVLGALEMTKLEFFKCRTVPHLELNKEKRKED